MRMEVNGEADVLFQILDKNFRSMGLDQPGHILDAQDMRTGVPQLLA